MSVMFASAEHTEGGGAATRLGQQGAGGLHQLAGAVGGLCAQQREKRQREPDGERGRERESLRRTDERVYAVDSPPLGALKVVNVRSKSANTCRLWLPLRMMSFFFLHAAAGQSRRQQFAAPHTPHGKPHSPVKLHWPRDEDDAVVDDKYLKPSANASVSAIITSARSISISIHVST